MRTVNRPMDHQPPRRALGDASGRAKPERVSEYFDFTTWPEKADRKVTRQELLAILTRRWKVEQDLKWYRRLWRALIAKRGSGPQVVGGGAKEQAS